MSTPTKKRTVPAQAAEMGPLPEMLAELIEPSVQGPMSPTDVQTLVIWFKRAVIERAMNAELNQHLACRSGEAKPDGQGNERNGGSRETVLTDTGDLRIDVPRDRLGSFELILIPKHERRFTGFYDKIVAMYVREIQGSLAENDGTLVSPDFISSVTDEVMAEALARQSRPLEPMYPVVFFDAVRVKVPGHGVVSNKAVYLALGIQADRQHDVLGLWVKQTEGPSSGSRSSTTSRPETARMS